jgi:hypothetical protein
MKALLASPALGERCHRSLARRFMRRATYLAVVAARPHPGAALRPDCIEEEHAADDDAVLQHIVIVIAPLSRRTRRRAAPEDKSPFSNPPRRILSLRHNVFLAQKHLPEPLMIIEPELSL